MPLYVLAHDHCEALTQTLARQPLTSKEDQCQRSPASNTVYQSSGSVDKGVLSPKLKNRITSGY